jgi:hypothetical protein
MAAATTMRKTSRVMRTPYQGSAPGDRVARPAHGADGSVGPQQPRQLGDVGGDAPGLVAGQQVRR